MNGTRQIASKFSCTVIIPVRNEAGNVRPTLEQIPQMGESVEAIFVESNSSDGTAEVLYDLYNSYTGPHTLSVYSIGGKGKWNAVNFGLEQAQGEIIILLDGDLTVSPEDLIPVYETIASGDADFVFGDRLTLAMEDGAMPRMNLVANKIFAALLSISAGKRISDSLCGTKAFRMKDFIRLRQSVPHVEKRDPYGDFTLIFGALMLGLSTCDIPLKYHAREYGKSNISHVRGGLRLFTAWVMGTMHLLFKTRNTK